jgi:hypothetical protein
MDALHQQAQGTGKGNGMNKPFSEDLFRDNDGKGKKAVSLYLINLGYDVIEGDKYGVDLICLRNEEMVGYAEVEVRHNWVNHFSYSSLHIPYRKKKFFQLELPTILFATNKTASMAFMVHDYDILISPIKNIPNKYLDHELFFDVPLKYCKKVYFKQHGK